ncbi:MAG: DNA topoisomerase, partial [Bacilli bacterium]
MKLIIAEKPDQAQRLAAPFGFKKQQGYLIIGNCDRFPNGAVVCWAVGHLLELEPPEFYDPKWKKWSLATLPMIPKSFKHSISKGKSKPFYVIKEWIQSSKITEIIIASDAGREGELIVRLILHQCQNKKPLKRLWISSLTEKSVRDGFNKLLNEADTRPLFEEAYSRSCADWLVGMNASRAYTLLLQQKGLSDVFSIGRVQTPTLALIIQRELEIENFISVPYWELNAMFQCEGIQFKGKWHKEGDSKIATQELAERMHSFCIDKDFTVQSVESEVKKFPPPLLYALNSLQKDANVRFKYSPQETLDIAQKLYTKGHISYPRSDSSWITKEEAKGLPSILSSIGQLPEYKEYFPLAVASIATNKRYTNEKKVTDHYAIIPTESIPTLSRLPAEERNVYDLIVRRVLAVHCESAEFHYTTIHTLVAERATFVSKGRIMIQEGWRKVAGIKEKEEEQTLPNVKEGASGSVCDCEVVSKKTEPP